MKSFRVNKKWLLDKLESTIFHKHIESKKDENLYFCVMDKEEFKSYKQNRVFHALIKELYNSGLSSFNSEIECKLYFKNVAGLIHLVDDKVVIDSWAGVTKENATNAINELIKYCYDCDLNTKKFQQIMESLNNVS